MTPQTFHGFVDDAGHFSLDNREAFRQACQRYRGQEIALTLKRWPKRQGAQQLRYLRGVVIPDIAAACGYTDQEDYGDVYEALMLRLFPLSPGPLGLPRRESCSHGEMTQQRLSEVIERIIVYAETTIPGCTVRRPEDVDMAQVVDQEFTP